MRDLAQLAMIFSSLSLLAVGGGFSALPEMQHQMATHGWASSSEFCHLYNLGQLAPGPNTLLVTMALGQRVAGVAGALVVCLAFILPASLLAFAAGRAWARCSGSPWRRSVQEALAPVTVGLMATGVWLIARVAVADVTTALIAALSTGLLVRRRPNATLLILGGGLLGVLFC